MSISKRKEMGGLAGFAKASMALLWDIPRGLQGANTGQR